MSEKDRKGKMQESTEEAQIKCPHCGSINTARYIYGNPVFSEEMEKMLETGKWVLGGCCINRVEMDGQDVDMDPAWKCNDCGRDFGTDPILITPKKNMVEDYRDIVIYIHFSIGGYFSGHTAIDIRRNAQGAQVTIDKFPIRDLSEVSDRQISVLKWEKIVARLYNQLYLHEWKKRYDDPYVLDGEQWSLEIGLTGRRKRTYCGSNAYPPYWKELLKIFRTYTKV